MKRLGVVGAAWEVCKKDVRIEMRTREVVATAGVFAIMVGVLASLAYFVMPKLNRATAAGTIWIAIFFAAVLSFSRIWQRERDESALTALLVSPIPRASIFLGKSLATFGTILVLALPLVALTMFLFAIDFSPPDDAMRDPNAVLDPTSTHVAAFAALLVLGAAALSLVGTLFGVMTVRTRARDLVLAIVLFPLLSPALVCGVAGTRNAFETQSFEDYRGFVALMALFVFVGTCVGVALFGSLVED
ncbi:MAG: heme exporter protein CcmB [Labilithrix sp.]|nr:heme exporter protein CcmB [Labilithrix sp.]MCW5810118.1 heme exporter protein CcmB [Labilithrix sp.]